MKQKDKKRLSPGGNDKLRNISLPDLDVLDETREKAAYKALRASHKQHDSRKNSALLIHGRVLEIKSNYLHIVEAEHQLYTASLSGRLKQFSYQSKAPTAVGDTVELDISNAPDYRIENILPRRTTLSRYAGGAFQKKVILAANIDQVIITASWRLPQLKPGLIDRYLCIAALEGLVPVIVINKADLCEDRAELDEIARYYRESGFQLICTSVVSGEGMGELQEALKDCDSVFSGQSGTGKSSLINWLEPGLELATSEVSDFNEKGVHTTTQSILLPWSFGGHLLDTPGIKTVTLHASAKAQIPRVFPGFENLALACRFRDCAHTHEADCAVLRAVEEGRVPGERYDSYLRILDSL